MFGLGTTELFLFILPAVAFWLWALIDCLRHEPEGRDERIVWVLVIALTHVAGALLYVLIRRPRRRAALEQ